MPSGPGARRLRSTGQVSFADVRRELEVPEDFPPAVRAEAKEAAAQADAVIGADLEGLDLPFVTIDPPGSKDLDQAVHVAATEGGFRVHYAIADVAAFVRPDGEMDREAWRRGVTLYSPDTRSPLYPPELSEGAASLLPGVDRRALVWRFDLDAGGNAVDTDLRIVRVRSVAQLDYTGVQAAIDQGSAHPSISVLADLGPILLAASVARGAISLPIPEQEVHRDEAGTWQLTFRTQLPVEQWNAEISLLTGRVAAAMMLEHGTGILRTLPAPADGAVNHVRREAKSFGIDWPDGAGPAQVLAGLDGSTGPQVAFIDEAATLLRGSGYTAFDGAKPEQSWHGGVAAEYAHVTAPLRRLVDRYANEACLAARQDRPVADWARTRLPDLPGVMTAADRRDSELERACLDATEVAVLAERRNEVFTAVVIDVGKDSANIVLTGLAVRAKCTASDLEAGQSLSVRVAEVDVEARTVTFVPASR